MACLMDACERQGSSKEVALSRALLSVLVYGGLRRQELLDLFLTDINLEDGREKRPSSPSRRRA